MHARRVAALASLLASLAFPAEPLAAEPQASPAEAGPVAAAPATMTLDAPKLTVDLRTAAVISGAELGLSGLTVVFKAQLVPPTCRWCEPPQLDRWARERLVWHDTRTAGTASDLFQIAVPAGAAAALWIRAAPHGGREVAEDLLVLTESASTAILLTQVAKFAVGRLRQDAWARGTIASPDDKLSFWSGHASSAFSAAAAATQIARLRGRPGWKWLGLATFSAAALTGYFRVAANRHWLTDVVSGAAVGSATGLLVPLLAYQPVDGRTPAVLLAPAPGGFAVVF
jgi:membrane-associated phospholipid phosphatase